MSFGLHIYESLAPGGRLDSIILARAADLTRFFCRRCHSLTPRYFAMTSDKRDVDVTPGSCIK
ncbi:hypothetical protein KQI84_08480 [bacterium]|nr:hypothetical protein [bacterium]